MSSRIWRVYAYPHRLAWLWLWVWLGLAAGTAACGKLSEDVPVGTDDVGEAGIEGGTGPAMAQCENLPFRVLSARGWPGGGVQLTITAPPLLGDEDAGMPEVRVGVGEGAPILVDAEAAPAPAGLTMFILLADADPAIHAGRLEALRTLVDALPAEERVALWVAGTGLRLRSDLTTDRRRLHALIDSEPAAAGDPPDDATMENLLSRLARAEGEWGAVSRNAIHVGEGETPPRVSADQAIRHFVLTQGVGPGDDTRRLFANEGSAADAARGIAEDIARERAGLVRLGACIDATPGEELRVFWGDEVCAIPNVPVVQNSRDHVCDAGSAARDVYPFGDVIDLDMSAEQRAIYDGLHAAKSEDDFFATMTHAPHGATGIRAHFRGHTSLDCDRKSLSIDIDGPHVRRLASDFAADEFFLISLCKDNRYFRQVLGNAILQDYGLFPAAFRLIELRIDGVSQGAYLLLQKPKHVLTANFLSTQAVVRRRNDANGGTPEVKFPDEPQAALLASLRYDELTQRAQGAADDELEAALDEVLDVDQFLRWTALNTLLENGDYVDEAFFYASANPSSAQPWYFMMMGWDMDDLARDCHHQGVNAVSRDNGLLYCAEGHIERTLLRSDPLYDRYVSQLETWLQVLDEAEMQARVDRVKDELAAVLDTEDACNAMTEIQMSLGADPGCTTLHLSIRSSAASYVTRIESRRTSLAQAIDTYRSK